MDRRRKKGTNSLIKCMIFDLDGTIVNLPIKYDIIQHNLKEIFKIEEKFQPLIPSIVSKANGDTKLIKKSFDMICEQEIIATDNLKIVDNAVDVLHYFQSKNLILCLITMQCRKAVDVILNKLDVNHIFANIITRNESFDRIEQIKKTISKFNLNTQEAVLIGDRIHDAKCASMVGCHSILLRKNKVGDVDTIFITKLNEIKKLNIFFNN